MSESYIFPLNKKEYIRGAKSKDCILCSIIKNEGKFPSLGIAQSKNLIACVNLYPYNSGHIMIAPLRHIVDLREMSEDEEHEMTLLTKYFMNIIEDLYSPSGFNIGYNLGEFSGASIRHIHRHIIPRYANEMGIIDIIGGSKVIIEDPKDTMQKLRDKVISSFEELSEIELRPA